MATSLSELSREFRSKPLVEYAWWKHHAAFFFSLFFALPMVLTFYYGLEPVYSYFGITSIVHLLGNVVLYLVFAILAVTTVGSWIGYYYDARYLETLDTDWSPHWGVYMALHVTIIFGGPLLAVPLYVLQRMRHVGLPIFA
ncbi:MAG: hypothetical protein ABEI57_07860 [Halapricum sp.]